MSSYFLLSLDTSGPNISIYTFNYTTRNSEMFINIVSNKDLSSYQNIYMINSLGERYDFIFSLDPELRELNGSFVLNGAPIGMYTLYAILEDTVGNRSMTSKSFVVLEGNNIKIFSSISELSIKEDVSFINIKLNDIDYIIIDSEVIQNG